MVRRGKKRGSAGAPPGKGALPPGGRGSWRSARQLFVLGERHVALLEELVARRPDLASEFDLRRVEPGSESIESFSWCAHRRLTDGAFDLDLFRVLCALNAERLRAHLAVCLDAEGLSCHEDELLGALFAAWRAHYCFRGATSETRGAVPHDERFGAIDATGSVWRPVAEVATAMVDERRQLIAAGAIPLITETRELADSELAIAPAAALVADAARHLERRRWRLPLGQLRRWTAFALFRLPREERRLLHLRTHRELSIADIAARLDEPPFMVGVRLARALEQLLAEIDCLLERHEPDAAVAEPAAPAKSGGRIVRFPGTWRERGGVETPPAGLDNPSNEGDQSDE